MHFSEVHRVFPRKGNTAVVTCPHCGVSQTVPVDRFSARKEPLRVRCSCGPVFGILVELRKTWRKKVQFHGRYSISGPAGRKGAIMVENVSEQGVGFTVLTDHEIRKGDRLNVIFSLDDQAQTVIDKEVAVKFVDKQFVGCAFIDKNTNGGPLENYLKQKA